MEPTHFNVVLSGGDNLPDFIKFTKQNRAVRYGLNILRWLDNDTGSYICFIPSLEISGYGNTPERSYEMAKDILREFIVNLIRLPAERRTAELKELGWKRSKFFNKQFSRAYVDVDGILQGFNVESADVEKLKLVA